MSSIDIKDAVVKLRNDIEKSKDDLLKKDSFLKIADDRILEMTKKLNEEKENSKKLESQVNDLILLSETLKTERDATLKEVELQNKRLQVLNERQHEQLSDCDKLVMNEPKYEQPSDCDKNDDSRVTLNDFIDNYPTEISEDVNSNFNHNSKDDEISQLQETIKNLTEQIRKLKGEVDSADKLQGLLGKERELLLSQTVKLQEEIEAAKQAEQVLLVDKDDVMEQLAKVKAHIEINKKAESERVLNAIELEKRYA